MLIMAKAYYVKFETPEELVSPILEALRVSATSGKVVRGTNAVSYTHLTLPTKRIV